MPGYFYSYCVLNILWVVVDFSSPGTIPHLLCNYCRIVFHNLVWIFLILQPDFHSVVQGVLPERESVVGVHTHTHARTHTHSYFGCDVVSFFLFQHDILSQPLNSARMHSLLYIDGCWVKVAVGVLFCVPVCVCVCVRARLGPGVCLWSGTFQPSRAICLLGCTALVILTWTYEPRWQRAPSFPQSQTEPCTPVIWPPSTLILWWECVRVGRTEYGWPRCSGPASGASKLDSSEVTDRTLPWENTARLPPPQISPAAPACAPPGKKKNTYFYPSWEKWAWIKSRACLFEHRLYEKRNTKKAEIAEWGE